MSFTAKFKTILTASFILLVISCNNHKPKKVTVQDVKIEDIQQEESKVEPPPPPPPIKEDVEMTGEKKCYVNNGLKYTTIITLFVDNGKAMGMIGSVDLESRQEEKKTFTGTINEGKISIKYDGTPPVIGAASEWTTKKWTLKKIGKKEVLEIIFNAKNYETNKWEETTYEFELTDCK